MLLVVALLVIAAVSFAGGQKEAAGNLEFGVVQSDRQSQAWSGEAEWKDRGKQENLRKVFALHVSATIIIAKYCNIEYLQVIKTAFAVANTANPANTANTASTP